MYENVYASQLARKNIGIFALQAAEVENVLEVYQSWSIAFTTRLHIKAKSL